MARQWPVINRRLAIEAFETAARFMQDEIGGGDVPVAGILGDECRVELARCDIGDAEGERGNFRQQVEFEAGGMPLLRLRIRERTRFTIFDIDPLTAERWGRQMLEWAAKAQEAK